MHHSTTLKAVGLPIVRWNIGFLTQTVMEARDGSRARSPRLDVWSTIFPRECGGTTERCPLPHTLSFSLLTRPSDWRHVLCLNGGMEDENIDLIDSAHCDGKHRLRSRDASRPLDVRPCGRWSVPTERELIPGKFI